MEGELMIDTWIVYLYILMVVAMECWEEAACLDQRNNSVEKVEGGGLTRTLKCQEVPGSVTTHGVGYEQLQEQAQLDDFPYKYK